MSWFCSSSLISWYCNNNNRSNNQYFSSLDCKTRWSLHFTWKCYTLKRLHGTLSAALWNFQVGCIWIHGWLGVTFTGERLCSSLWSMRLRKRNNDKGKVHSQRFRNDASGYVLMFFLESITLGLTLVSLVWQEGN